MTGAGADASAGAMTGAVTIAGALRSPLILPPPPTRPSELAPLSGGRRAVEQPGFRAEVGRDGRVRFHDRASIRFPTFDVTDLAERLAGNDPYASQKLALLDRTRDERLAMALDEGASDLREAVLATPARLGRIWRSTAPAIERRRLLFELWDEAAEDGPADVVAAARAVRATILTFIRRELEQDGPDAYGARELEALNAGRVSRERFAPYR
jgi:hypothetical protein